MMRVEKPKQREWSESLFNRAVEFHGHGGPFMVVGLRMGLLALNRLDANGWFDLRCRIEVKWKPPDSCIIDGIQSATGCTMGKHNVEVDEGDRITAVFADADKKLKIRLKHEILEEIRWYLVEESEERILKLMGKLIEAPAEALFEIS